MQIKIPMRLVRWWDSACDLLNIQLYVRGRHEVRLVDVLLVFGFVFCTGWYWVTLGWQGALAASVMFVAISALALFMRG